MKTAKNLFFCLSIFFSITLMSSDKLPQQTPSQNPPAKQHTPEQRINKIVTHIIFQLKQGPSERFAGN